MRRLLAAGALLALLPHGAALADAATVPGPRELRFGRGNTAVTVADAVVRGERHLWRFSARAGQTASIKVGAVERNAAITIWRPGATLPAAPGGDIAGRTLRGAGGEDDATRWHGRLPDSGDYLIVVGPTRGNATYKLTLKIQP